MSEKREWLDELDEAIGKLSAAALQSSPNDDQIIADHVRDSVALLLKARHKLREDRAQREQEAMKKAELLAALREVRGHIRDYDYELAIDTIDAAIAKVSK